MSKFFNSPQTILKKIIWIIYLVLIVFIVRVLNLDLHYLCYMFQVFNICFIFCIRFYLWTWTIDDEEQIYRELDEPVGEQPTQLGPCPRSSSLRIHYIPKGPKLTCVCISISISSYCSGLRMTASVEVVCTQDLYFFALWFGNVHWFVWGFSLHAAVRATSS
jgi:hypothetical protein